LVTTRASTPSRRTHAEPHESGMNRLDLIGPKTDASETITRRTLDAHATALRRGVEHAEAQRPSG